MTRTSSLIACAVMLAAAVTRPANALEQIEIVETGTASALRWPAYLAADVGIFAKHELDVRFVAAPSSAAVMQQVASASVQLGAGNPLDAARAIDRGAPITILRLESTNAPYEIYAKSTISKVTDLPGKTLMVGGIKDITRYYFDTLLKRRGVDPKSVDYVFAGATAQRFAALASGSIDATILTPPFTFNAAAGNYRKMGASPDFANGVPFSAVVINRRWLADHGTQVASFLAAYDEAVSQFYHPNDLNALLTAFAKRAKISLNEARQTYDFMISVNAIGTRATITADDIDRMQAILSDQGDALQTADLATYYQRK
jgi:NitT/TauT family transport system substrate-binding protein